MNKQNGIPFPTTPMLDRRRFLKISATAPVALAATSLSGGLGIFPFANAEAAIDIPAHELRYLNGEDVMIIASLLPVVLAGAMPEDLKDAGRAELIKQIDGSLDRLAPYIKNELRRLLDIMSFAPGRVLLARVWSPWDEASDQDLDAFLNRWRDSSIPLLRSAYSALHEMITFAWYGDPASWDRVGYSGPPDIERPSGEQPA